MRKVLALAMASVVLSASAFVAAPGSAQPGSAQPEGPATAPLPEPQPEPRRSFPDWLTELRGEAERRGVSAGTLDATLAQVRLLDEVIALDRKQPEFSQTFWQYLDRRITPQRIERARRLLTEHRGLLEATQRRFGVQPRFVVAFWALESNFGDFTGSHSAVSALATLAFDDRRSGFFREQLLALLQSIDDGDIPAAATGSWAGALGQPQFIPTTYRRFGVDGDGDGRRDLWGSLADVFASTANYLAASGWDEERTWGREVRLPANFDLTLSGLETQKPLAEWKRLGVRDAGGGALPSADLSASLLLPGGVAGGPALLVYPNFRTIMTWNRSILYAVAVGHLADRIAGAGPFRAVPPANDVALSRTELMEIQDRLGRLGFDIGDPDGVVGPRTRRAIMSFQQEARLPADGYPTGALLDTVRRLPAQ
ncbi:MAG: lytic murein transglycosylase [Rhodospirillales bacterium]|nr:lytic murein transglycosylase [Rhodospirillales bacterium]